MTNARTQERRRMLVPMVLVLLSWSEGDGELP